MAEGDELEAIRQLKARYCRFLDTKDVDSWRGVFTADVVVTVLAQQIRRTAEP